MIDCPEYSCAGFPNPNSICFQCLIRNWNLFCKTDFICPFPLSAPPQSSIKFGRKEKQDFLLFLIFSIWRLKCFVSLNWYLFDQVIQNFSFCWIGFVWSPPAPADILPLKKNERQILCWIGICLIRSCSSCWVRTLSHVSNIGAAASRGGEVHRGIMDWLQPLEEK